MLKQLFTSNARVKLLTLFLLNPDEEFFIRELTRKLKEQINSVRRELTNLKKMGLLKSKTKNRKKYYIVNKHFIFFNELRNIIIKTTGGTGDIIKHVQKLGKVDLIVLSGQFIDRKSPADMLIVGKIFEEDLQEYLEVEIKREEPIRYSVMSREDFLYRFKMHDKFVIDFLKDPDNIVGVNKLENHLS
jgi:predicted transcriptional regulator